MAEHGKTVLVTGAGGLQGRPIVRTLVDRGYAVKALTRGKVDALPAGAGSVVGDLGDMTSLRLALEDADALVALLPLEFDEEVIAAYARNLTEAARRSGVRRVVFDTSAPVPRAPVGVAAVDTKLVAERIFREAAIDLTVIRPTLYMGNLAAPWTAPGIVTDRTIAYPLAAAVPCAWITWEDAAACVAAALRDDATAGRAYDVGGPETLDGAGVAAAFMAARGTPHAYSAIPTDTFEVRLSQVIGQEAGRGIAALYRWFNTTGAPHLAPGPEGTAALGVTPTAMRDWAAQMPWEAIAR